jgi:hypothetical protein
MLDVILDISGAALLLGQAAYFFVFADAAVAGAAAPSLIPAAKAASGNDSSGTGRSTSS